MSSPPRKLWVPLGVQQPKSQLENCILTIVCIFEQCGMDVTFFFWVLKICMAYQKSFSTSKKLLLILHLLQQLLAPYHKGAHIVSCWPLHCEMLQELWSTDTWEVIVPHQTRWKHKHTGDTRRVVCHTPLGISNYLQQNLMGDMLEQAMDTHVSSETSMGILRGVTS